MPTLVRFLLMHALFGIALGLVATAAILYFDIAGLGTRFGNSPGWLPEALLAAQMGLTFGAIQMGLGIMNLQKDKDGDEDDDDD